MASIAPFRAWRYNPKKVSRLDDVTCPPYDVIGKKEQRDLYAKHPWNIVRLELGEDFPQDSHNNNRYTRALEYLQDWRSSGILIRDQRPCLYVYHHRFRGPNGNQLVRRGILALLRLEPFGEGMVFPHEETFPKQKRDRLKLLRTCKAQFNPIFSIFPDPNGELQDLLESPDLEPDASAVDANGVEHLLWVLDDPLMIEEITRILFPKPVFIADGHHRYETSLTYQKELAVREDLGHPANWTFAYLSPMEDPGLIIFPTHKLIKATGMVSQEGFLDDLKWDFRLVEVPWGGGSSKMARKRLEELMKGAQGDALWTIGLAISGRTSYWALRPKAELFKGDVLSHVPEPLRILDVTVLHELILKKRLCVEVKADGEVGLIFCHDLEEALDLVEKGKAQMGFLMNPIPVSALKAVATAQCKMPPKATYFYPKLLSGLAIRTLGEDDRVALHEGC